MVYKGLAYTLLFFSMIATYLVWVQYPCGRMVKYQCQIVHSAVEQQTGGLIYDWVVTNVYNKNGTLNSVDKRMFSNKPLYVTYSDAFREGYEVGTTRDCYVCEADPSIWQCFDLTNNFCRVGTFKYEHKISIPQKDDNRSENVEL